MSTGGDWRRVKNFGVKRIGAEMAGDWIPWVKGLLKRPEIIRISGILGVSREQATCALMEVWEWCDSEGHFDEVSRDCHVHGVTLPFLVTLTGVTGFGDALKSVGWVAIESDGHLVFPSLGRWVGKSAKERLLASDRKKKQRANVTEMSRSKRDKNGTRVEESRVDSNTLSLSGDIACKFAESTEIPEPYQTAEFSIAWGKWLNHRAAICKPLTGPEADMQLAAMLRSGWDSKRATAAVEYTIANGGRGNIFENDRQTPASGRKTSKLTPIEEMDLTR